MAKRSNDIKARLLAVFRVEAQEHLQSITANLQKLESELPPEEAQAVLEATFREVHTLKGAARSVSLLSVEALCQAEESLLSRITRGRLTLTRPILDLLHLGMDGVVRLVSEGEAAADMRGLIERLKRAVEEAGVGDQGLGVGKNWPAPIP